MVFNPAIKFNKNKKVRKHTRVTGRVRTYVW